MWRPPRGQFRPSVALRLRIAIALLLSCLLPASVHATPLIDLGSSWRYLDDGSDQGAAWKESGFDDNGWASGPARLGYGGDGEVTLLSYGPDPDDKHITAYFRHTFPAVDPDAYEAFALEIVRDDGAVVYLNGTEVFRTNMPSGAIDFRTRAASTVSGSVEDALHLTGIDPALLQAGDNVVAVELHQRSSTSSDTGFDLRLQPTSNTVVRGPYLQMGTEDAVTVRWRTLVPTDSRVEVGSAPGSLSLQFDDAGLTTDHAVRVTGLSVDTTYYYAVGSQSERLAGGDADHFLVTAPPAGGSRAFRVWALGDSGTANANARAVRDAYYAHAAGTYTDLVMMLGDNAYDDGTDEEYQRAVFDMYPGILRSSVLWPTLGNHDGHAADSASESGPYYDIFTLPRAAEAGGVASGTEAYYSFDYGDVHFICLDSYESDRSPSGAMLTWLESDLMATDATWVVAYWHHPPYSKGSHDSDSDGRMTDMRENVLPILDDYGVELVLSGHSHSYERSMLIQGHYGSAAGFGPQHVVDGGDGDPGGDGAYVKLLPAAPHDGAVYAVAGSSGKISGGSLDHPVMVVNLNVLGSVILDFDGNTLDASFLDSAGTVRDAFRITKVAPTPTPMPSPTPTPAPTLEPGTDVLVGYKARASLLVDNRLPRDWVVLLDDIVIDDADVDDPENYEARRSSGLLNPAADLAGVPDSPSRHYVRYSVKEGPQGVGPPDESGRFPKPEKHVRRTWQLDNELGSVVVGTTRVASLLVPASVSEVADPEAPGNAVHYVCYRARLTAGQDSEQVPSGAARSDLQLFAGDAFDDCARDRAGAVAFEGTAAEGLCLFHLRRPTRLCNPVGKRAVEAPRESSATGIVDSLPGPGPSLLCYRARLAKKASDADVAAVLGLEVGDRLVPGQERHVARKLKTANAVRTAAGNGFTRPTRMDTAKVETVCLPTTVVGVVAP